MKHDPHRLDRYSTRPGPCGRAALTGGRGGGADWKCGAQSLVPNNLKIFFGILHPALPRLHARMMPDNGGTLYLPVDATVNDDQLGRRGNRLSSWRLRASRDCCEAIPRIAGVVTGGRDLHQ